MAGLTEEQVRLRIEAGQVNENDNPNTRTYKQIIRENTLTFFNFLNVVLLVLVLIVGSYKNSLFVMIIVINTIFGIFQEVRAKKTLDKLAILTASKALVIRDGKEQSLATDQLVLDDSIILKTGDQVPADVTVVDGTVEVNESLLTGESDVLVKNPGDGLYSGSFITSGHALCQVIHVGKENYASKITSEAKEFKKHNSELRNSLNKILKVISIIILPLGVALFYKQFYLAGGSFAESVVSTVAAVLGMIPEGLVLLTSGALTVGAMKLAQRKTLVQELFCIETLARVDTLCLDKTGTITEGTICVDSVLPLKEEFSVEQAMGNLMFVLEDDNATFEAARKYFKSQRDFTLDHVIPFSSDRKYSGACFNGKGTYLMGAVQFLFPEGNGEVQEKCDKFAMEGYRVLVLAHSPLENRGTELPEELEACAILLMTDVIREEAPDTLAFFDSQGVDLKVISGDDPVTVSAIAKKAGLKNAENYIDATTIRSPEEMEEAVRTCSVFGRVTPQQKKEMVLALQAQDHIVAMTGDGVNDVLALKEADTSIVMASGSDAAKNIANLVLLDSNFASMPEIVNQGRKVVNNMRMAASMFLIKTLFSVGLSILTVFFGEAYPFEPIQMSLISACAVGIPTFLLALFEPNYDKIDSRFLRYVFMKAFPTAITIVLSVFSVMLVCAKIPFGENMLSTACVMVAGWNYMDALTRVYSPPTTYRKVVIYGMQFIFFAGLLIGQGLLNLKALQFTMIVMVFALMTISPLLTTGITKVIVAVREFFAKHRKKKAAA